MACFNIIIVFILWKSELRGNVPSSLQDKDQKTILDLVFLSRAIGAVINTSATPALVNWSIEVNCSAGKPHIIISDRAPCIYCDQFQPKISTSPLLDVRKINSESGTGEYQSISCHIQRQSIHAPIRKIWIWKKKNIALNLRRTVWYQGSDALVMHGNHGILPQLTSSAPQLLPPLSSEWREHIFMTFFF